MLTRRLPVGSIICSSCWCSTHLVSLPSPSNGSSSSNLHFCWGHKSRDWDSIKYVFPPGHPMLRCLLYILREKEVTAAGTTPPHVGQPWCSWDFEVPLAMLVGSSGASAFPPLITLTDNLAAEQKGRFACICQEEPNNAHNNRNKPGNEPFPPPLPHVPFTWTKNLQLPLQKAPDN